MKRAFMVVTSVLLLLVLIFAGVASQTPGGSQQVLEDARRTFRVTFGLPKFWYDINLVASAKDPEVPCPDPAQTLTIVTGGQSNAANHLKPLTASRPEVQVYSFDAGRCFTAADPMPGASGNRGSLWPDLGRRLHQATGRPVMFVNGGIGSTQVGDWLDARSGYLDNLTSRIAGARRLGFEPKWIIWHQGEGDAATSIKPARFEAQLTELTTRLLAAAPDARLYMFEATLCTRPRNLPGVAAFRNAQRHVAAANPRIVGGMNTDTLDARYRWDGCHFNAAGREIVVAEVMQALVAGR